MKAAEKSFERSKILKKEGGNTMLRRFLHLLGFHKWIGFEPTLADAIRGRFMARMKCYFCKNWHPDHDVSLPEIDEEIESMIQKLVIL